MKQTPVLFYSLLFTLLIEFIFIVLSYISIGPDRLFVQGIRISLQILLIVSILTDNKKGLFILVGYHIIVGLDGLILKDTSIPIILILGIYHIVIGILIYFHDYIEEHILKIKKQ